ncbi:MAG TPA: hypothetical protein VIA06_01895 [Candidatus Dormibacteraeota bacterium]|jgi:hypothetical protein|nr:hypothetical protein [Candidatus Dormibacteraeota bacterium]
MFVTAWIIFASILLVISAFFAYHLGTNEGLFSGTMAVLGIVVMLATVIIYPLTRKRNSG